LSIYEYHPNGENTQPVFQIGTIGWEDSKKISQLPDSIVPTYGLWAGPGWSPGVTDEEGNQIRPLANSQIDWATDPCMNDS
jgi:cell wall assembly regulator SMI1